MCDEKKQTVYCEMSFWSFLSGLFDCIVRYFESLHTNGDRYLIEDFDDFIANHAI